MAGAGTAVGQRLRAELERVIAGNEAATFGVLVALLAGGHVLLEGVPGTAKTLIVRVLARLLGVGFRRIQFTPDLMPADIIGTTVFDPAGGTFSFRHGPVFTHVVLADEINRTPPKTQSALLEAMEERQVTIDGESHPIAAPFFVCATQNPIEFEGTYPLPEAQLDRFIVRARTGYPSEAQERALLARTVAGFDAHDLATAGVEAVAGAHDILAAQAAVRATHVEPAVQEYILALATASRAAHDVALGVSPRGALALLAAAQAAAALEGRAFVTPDDVKTVAPLVLAHRIIVRPEAELEGSAADAIVTRLLATVPAPT
ncbi:MAG: MoxR family ATPase [Candidatus Lustribacter sp.]